MIFQPPYTSTRLIIKRHISVASGVKGPNHAYQGLVIIHVCSCAKKFTYVLTLDLWANFEFSVDSQVLVMENEQLGPYVMILSH